MSNGTFDFNEFIKESKSLLVDPKSYFSGMKTSGGMSEPLIKALIYGAVSGVISFVWSLLNVLPAAGGIIGGSIGIMIFVSAIIGAIIGLFIGGVVILVLSAICKGNTDYEANVRVTAALMIMMPIKALLGFTSSINLYLGVIIGIAVSVFSLWLLYNALIEALKSKPETTKILSYILIAIFVLFSLIGIGTKKAANKFMNDFNNTDFQEIMKDLEDKN